MHNLEKQCNMHVGLERKHGSIPKEMFYTVEETKYAYCVSLSGRNRLKLLLKFQSGRENAVCGYKSTLKMMFYLIFFIFYD